MCRFLLSVFTKPFTRLTVILLDRKHPLVWHCLLLLLLLLICIFFVFFLQFLFWISHILIVHGSSLCPNQSFPAFIDNLLNSLIYMHGLGCVHNWIHVRHNRMELISGNEEQKVGLCAAVWLFDLQGTWGENRFFGEEVKIRHRLLWWNLSLLALRTSKLSIPAFSV